MIDFISSSSPEKGIAALVNELIAYLNAGKKVLWLIAGGSNIPTAVAVMSRVRSNVAAERLSKLTISQTDERYGPIGHQDSNWRQMIEAGFDFVGTNVLPVLRDLPLDETADEWSKEMDKAFADADIVVGQFGMGQDGHIAGILPHSQAVNVPGSVASYEDKFTRITLTPAMLKRIGIAYAFVYGDMKKKAVADLRDEELSLDEEPAQVFKDMPEVHFYTDCL